MKKLNILLITGIVLLSSVVLASGMKVSLPEGGILLSEKDAYDLVYQYPELTLADAEIFFRNEFKDDEAEVNWKISDDKNEYTINDWGSRDWHKITIHKMADNNGVEISVQKDSWTWIIGTLVIRFVGVLIVLSLLMIALYISGAIFKIALRKKTEEAESKS